MRKSRFSEAQIVGILKESRRVKSRRVVPDARDQRGDAVLVAIEVRRP